MLLLLTWDWAGSRVLHRPKLQHHRRRVNQNLDHNIKFTKYEKLQCAAVFLVITCMLDSLCDLGCDPVIPIGYDLTVR